MNKEVFINYLHQYINLLSLYLNKKEAKEIKIDENTFSFIFNLAKHHSLSALTYKALEAAKVDINPSLLRKLEEAYYLNLKKVVLFEKERKELYLYLDNKEINYLPLKGIILKDYYPDPNTREFADNDILFDSKDKEIRQFFIKRGYKSEYFRKSNHDVYLKKPCYNFEMHRALFGETGDNEIVVNYFSNYLSKAHLKDHHQYELSHEDFYIYFAAHTHKHFHVSGCGIRTLIDYYLFLKQNKDLDFNYINQELAKIDLVDFSNQISSLSLKLFDNEKLNEKEEEMLLFIASSGTYGTLENSVSQGVKKKGKFKYFMSRVFPPYRFYKSAYPWAYYSFILIAIAWLARFFRILFKNPKKAKKELQLISEYQEEDKK